MRCLALALLFAMQEDEFSKQVERLRSDSIWERREAALEIQKMGMQVIDRLKKEAASASDLESRVVMESLIEQIPKIAELAKVYGPTKRITLSAKERRLEEVAEELGKALDEKFYFDGADRGIRVTLDLRKATLWEALDRLCREARIHYSYQKVGIVLRPGMAPELPAIYYEQFRISVAEVKRIEYRAEGLSGTAVVVVIEVLYQRNLSPGGSKFHDIFSSIAIRNAAGAEVSTRGPGWCGTPMSIRQSFGLQQDYFVRPDAGPFSVEGTANVAFAQASREITIPLNGKSGEEETSDGRFRAEVLKSSASTVTLALVGNTPALRLSYNRLKGVFLVDAEGGRHEGKLILTRRGDFDFNYHYKFPPGIREPKSAVFGWVEEVHPVEIPFRLVGIRIP